MSTDQKTIDAYNKIAEQWSDNHQNGRDLNHTYNEKPAMYKLLPELKGQKVLCIGCGSGEECKYMYDLGADIIGTDISEGLIEQAEKAYPEINFQIMDMENLQFEDSSFDFIYSSLAVHYIDDWTRMVNEIKRVLKIEGEFLFSTMHPLLTSTEWVDLKDGWGGNVVGRLKNKETKEYRVAGNYLDSNKLQDTDMGDDLVVTWYHKSIETVFNYFNNAGFICENLVETKVLDEMKEHSEKRYAFYSILPEYLVMKWKKV